MLGVVGVHVGRKSAVALPAGWLCLGGWAFGVAYRQWVGAVFDVEVDLHLPGAVSDAQRHRCLLLASKPADHYDISILGAFLNASSTCAATRR